VTLSAEAPPRGRAVWVTGLPASGKTTLANALVAALRRRGEVAIALDGDDLRPFVFGSGGYDPAARDRFYRLLSHLAKLGADGGATVVVSATAHRRQWRDQARQSIARFYEVFIDADAATCAARDPKGLWRAAAEGRIDALPGAGADYERPLHAEVIIAPEQSCQAALDQVLRVLG
jgi:adenylylsulfate kinase